MLDFDQTRAAIVAGVERFVARLDALDGDDWNRRTRCPGWCVRDVAWHIGWYRGPNEVIRAAREGLGPVRYATERIPPVPAAPEILESAHRSLEQTRLDLGALGPGDATMIVRYGVHDPGRPLIEYLKGVLCEVVVHLDDLQCAIGVNEPADAIVAGELVERRVRGAVGWASNDGLQPTSRRGYRLTGQGIDCGFHWLNGSWSEGIDDSVPTCTFTSDNTTLLRLVMGRIPVSPFETMGRSWDDRLKLSGDLGAAPPFDFMRWCYGAW